jgi:hypothetical protein
VTFPTRLPLTGLPVAETGRRSALLAAWATAHLAGQVDPRGAMLAITGADEPHVVDGLTAGDDLAALLADLRARRATGLRLVLPVPGDPRGLPGPGELTDLALRVGEAVRVQEPRALRDGAPSYGLVPVISRAGTDTDGYAVLVRWQVLACPAAEPGPAGGGRQAERDLSDALRDVASALTRLDVARLGPAGADALAALRADARRGRPPVRLPVGHPAEAQTLLAQADRLAAVLDIAGADDGAAIDRGTAADRRGLLRELGGAVRRARVASVNAPLDE